MGFMSRSIVAGEFKLGILQARQIIRIENGGLVISSSDARYQPGPGIRHEISPDEWFLHTYAFFPRYYPLEAYERGAIKNKIYYDYFSEEYPVSPRHGDVCRYIYAIFKSGQDTGFRIVEEKRFHYLEKGSISHDSYRECVGSRYSGLYILNSGISRYRRTTKDHLIKPFEDARHINEAAVYMMSDLEFESEYIKLGELNNDCKSDPGSCVLHEQLVAQLSNCRHARKYVIAQ